jgi:hypothetical protein
MDVLAGCAALLALGRLRQEDQKFKASVGYTVRPCLENKQTDGQTKYVLIPALASS